MITTLLILLANFILSFISFILPTWQIWPTAIFDGLHYFCVQIAKFNFLFPVDTLFSAIIFFIGFEVLYFTAKLTMKIFNFIRGTGSGLDI